MNSDNAANMIKARELLIRFEGMEHILPIR